MHRSHKPVSLLACLALIAVGFASARALVAEAAPASSTSTVARVYLQTDQGLNVYNAAGNGALSLIKGSPFSLSGTWLEADNGSYLFTFDAKNNIHSYQVESNGTPGKQVAEINAGDYDGSDCSKSPDGFGIARGILDHTGKSLYVQLYGYATDYSGGETAVCSAYQSYQVGSNGKLTFNGAYVFNDSCCEYQQNLTFTGSDKFVYGLSAASNSIPKIQSFIRESNGALEDFSGSAETPPAPGSGYTWEPALIDADPDGHAAMLGIFMPSSPNGSSSGWKIGSFTVGGSGDLTTSNTYAELATPKVIPAMFNFSPSGNLLAAAGEGQGNSGGLQIFHWNGSKPPTTFGATLTAANDVEVVHWDNNSHLYAVGNDNKIYVYTVTTSKITPAGSPHSFTGALTGQGLIVRPL